MATTISLKSDHTNGFAHWYGDAFELIHQLKHSSASNVGSVLKIGRSHATHMQYNQVHSFQKINNNAYKVTLNLPGLFGPLGVLPLFDQELTSKSSAEVQDATVTFFDIFHHQLSLCAYQSWLNNRLIKSYHVKNRTLENANEQSLVMHRFLACLANTENNRSHIDDYITSKALLLRKKELSTSVLESLLKAYLNIPMVIINLNGIYQKAEKDDLAYLSSISNPSALGENTILGETIYVYHNQIKLVIGPLSYKDYQSFLPGGNALDDLQRLVKKLVSFQFEVRVQLILDQSDIPLLTLQKPLVQLGRTTWLYSNNIVHHKNGCSFTIC
jgi:type VI secretion system protein ImpH